jgi:TonB family protein
MIERCTARIQATAIAGNQASMDLQLAKDSCTCAVDRASAGGLLNDVLQQDASRRRLAQYRVALSGIVHSCMGEMMQRDAERLGKLPLMDMALDERVLTVLPEGAQVPNGYVPAKLIDPKCWQAEYPKLAIKENVTGTTRLAFFIEKTGAATKVRISQTSGDTPIHKLLDFSAVAASARCKFEPATMNGQPQQSWTTAEYVWVIQ